MKHDEVKVPQLTGYNEDLGLKRVVVESSCANCQHSDRRRESIVEYLRARGITQVTDAHGQGVPGENTISKDFEWKNIVPALEHILLCRVADKTGGPGCEMVMPGFCCVRWEEDRGRVFVAQPGK